MSLTYFLRFAPREESLLEEDLTSINFQASWFDSDRFRMSARIRTS